MNITESLKNYIEAQLGLTFGENLFIGGAPALTQRCMWLLAAGGNSLKKNVTNERTKNYTILVYYRNLDAADVYETLQSLEELINSGSCTQLDGYDTIELEATLFPTDQDIDNVDRTVGLLQITVTVYTAT